MAMSDAEIAGQKFVELVRILDTLRGEDGCPWDRKQDERSIVNYFLEEAYETAEAVYQAEYPAIAEELGDMLMEVVFLSRIYKEKGQFQISDVVEGINNKMVRRHPHVFGEKTAKETADVIATWNQQKTSEKNRRSVYEGISRVTPALLSAFQIGLRAAMQGFDWADAEEVLPQVREELSELEKAVKAGQDRKAVVEEIGDLFFALANLSRHLGINPELALKFANQKFMRRFQYIEEKLRAKGKTPEQVSLDDMEALYQEAKQEEE
jgi:MazG family protein